MEINSVFSKKRQAIIDKAFNLTISTYPEGGISFLKGKHEQFTNPVGYNIYQSIQKIVDNLIADESLESFVSSIEEIIRIRAVQDFTPSQAVGFIFLLKKAIYDELYNDVDLFQLMDYLSRIDSLALIAFDIFMKYREKIYDLKSKELIDRTWWVLKKWNIVSEINDEKDETVQK
ncbi:MAG TPA: RsbRD N-terminal domain-containing protein [Thermodesulfovibrio thiophilus]|nr:RsbRD N-terminal domain-containing protein [Thermodesulfovibrio thiophilus]